MRREMAFTACTRRHGSVNRRRLRRAGCYLDRLLNGEDFWAVAFDIAVRADYQRQGVGRHLVTVLRGDVR